MTKLPDAKNWQERDIDDWNTLSFTEYLKAKHLEVFGIVYAPMRGWRFEQGHLGTLIGTKTKESTHSKAVVKRFIDECFETYSPTHDYPGTNFGFIYSYRRNVLQRLAAEELADKRAEVNREEAPALSDLTGWL